MCQGFYGKHALVDLLEICRAITLAEVEETGSVQILKDLSEGVPLQGILNAEVIALRYVPLRSTVQYVDNLTVLGSYQFSLSVA